MINLNFFQQQR